MTQEEIDKHYIEPQLGDIVVEGKLVSVTMDCVVADTRQLWDEDQQLFQSDINKKQLVQVILISTKGLVLKNGCDTKIYAQVYKNNENITDSIDAGKFYWVRISDNPAADTIWNNEHKWMKEVEVPYAQIVNGCTFECNVNLDN